MSSRQQILAAVRKQLPVDAPLPGHDGPWTRYDDPRAQFFDVLASVGGRGTAVSGHDALRRAVAEAARECGARRVFSVVPEAIESTLDWEAVNEPHDLADIDLAVLRGELAVAENAAVWVTDAETPRRAAYFIAQHLVLVVPAQGLVHHMHEAYERIAAAVGDGDGDGRPFAQPLFGTFISGPSKTADIEQSLVIGAHGPRSLTVVLAE